MSEQDYFEARQRANAMITKLCERLTQMGIEDQLDVAFYIATLMFGQMAIWGNINKEAMEEYTKPCGKPHCNCHIQARRSIDAMVKFAESIPPDEILTDGRGPN